MLGLVAWRGDDRYLHLVNAAKNDYLNAKLKK